MIELINHWSSLKISPDQFWSVYGYKIFPNYRSQFFSTLYFLCFFLQSTNYCLLMEFVTLVLNFMFCYKDNVISLINPKFYYYVNRIYFIELEIQDTTYTIEPAASLDLHLELTNIGSVGKILYDKKRWFQRPDFPFLCSKILKASAYGVNIYQLKHFSRASVFFQDFLERELLRTKKLLQISKWWSWNHYFVRFKLT